MKVERVGSSGAAGQTAAYPLDTVRRILQVQDQKGAYTSGGVEKYNGMFDALVRLARRDGIGALYRGLGANYLKVVPSVATAFVVFEFSKKSLEEQFPPRKRQGAR